MANLVHLVELALEDDEFTAFFRLSVDHTGFECLEGVDNLEEVAVIEEEAEVFQFRLFDDGFNWEEESILIEVVLEVRSGVRLQSKLNVKTILWVYSW